MQFIKPDVSTICIGQAASMGAVLLAGGSKGKRFSLPNSRILIHQPMGGMQGQASDIQIHANEIARIKSLLNTILASHTGKPVSQIEKDTDRDNIMSPEEAISYGLMDRIITKKEETGDDNYNRRSTITTNAPFAVAPTMKSKSSSWEMAFLSATNALTFVRKFCNRMMKPLYLM